MSVRILEFVPLSSRISHIAIPATCFLIGTPASIRDKQAAQVEAIDEEPLDESVSATTRMVYGKSSFFGIIAVRALAASAPCPISLRPGPRERPDSPTANPGKL